MNLVGIIPIPIIFNGGGGISENALLSILIVLNFIILLIWVVNFIWWRIKAKPYHHNSYWRYLWTGDSVAFLLPGLFIVINGFAVIFWLITIVEKYLDKTL